MKSLGFFYYDQIFLQLVRRAYRWIRYLSKIPQFIKKSCRVHVSAILNQVILEGFNFISKGVVISNCEIGLFSYVAHDTSINDAVIGRFCSIGMNVIIGPGRHPVHYVSSHPFFYSSLHEANGYNNYQSDFKEKIQVKIGNDVWIGAGVIVLDGIEIGNGAIVAAGSVVTKNVESYAIVGGVPARKIKMRFEHEKISELLQHQWWNQSLNDLRERSKEFCKN